MMGLVTSRGAASAGASNRTGDPIFEPTAAAARQWEARTGPKMADEFETDVRLSQQGDRKAFEALVARFQKQVFFTVFRVLQDSHLADDVTQEVFVNAYRALPRLQDPGFF